jgi:hypothetical protein
VAPRTGLDAVAKKNPLPESIPGHPAHIIVITLTEIPRLCIILYSHVHVPVDLFPIILFSYVMDFLDTLYEHHAPRATPHLYEHYATRATPHLYEHHATRATNLCMNTMPVGLPYLYVNTMPLGLPTFV